MRLNLRDDQDNAIGSTSSGGPHQLEEDGQGALDRLRDVLSGLDVVIGVLLAAMLLPLLLFPFFVLYLLVEERSYAAAVGVAVVVLACYVLVGRDVRRGEFSPYTVPAVVATAIIVMAAAAYVVL